MDVRPASFDLQEKLNAPPSPPTWRFWSRPRLPVLLQSGAAECGLVCLAMVASYWGHEIDVASIRKRFAVSLKGANMKGLVQMAESLEMRARPVKLDLDKLHKLDLPAILHWDMNHFVVLKSIGDKGAVIHDPAVGVRTVSMQMLSQSFTGVALEVQPGASFKAQQEKLQFSTRALVGDVRGLHGGLAQLFILGIALQVLALLAPFYLQWVVDEALVGADRDLVVVLGLGFLLLAFLRFAIEAVRSWLTTVLSTSLNFQWFGNVFSHLLRLPLPYFEERHLGDIVSRFGSIDSIQKALTTQVVNAVIDGVLVIVTLVAMLFYSVVLAAVAGGAVLAYALLRLSLYRKLRGATAEMVIKAARQQTLFLESIRGMQAIRLFGRSNERRVLWMNALADQMNVDVRIARLSITHGSANTLLAGVERVAIIWIAALAVLDGDLTVGMLIAFLGFRDQFSTRMAALIDNLFDIRMLRVQGERLADIVLTAPEETVRTHEVDVTRFEPSIEFRNVSFRYSEGDPYILKDLSLTIPAGQCVAISGPSGCGKTTLVKLLLGLLSPTQGQILIGGENIQTIGLSNYRQITGSVMQDDLLFAGTIADNIAFFDPESDAARIEECARLAAIERDILSMPMRYMTLIGDLGSGLSGGQKQRIVLARALYRSPRLLVLDEATSHLDLVNEQTINNAIDRLAMTRVLVAHRPDTIAMAERIVLLDSGEVVVDQLNNRARRSAHPLVNQPAVPA